MFSCFFGKKLAKAHHLASTPILKAIECDGALPDNLLKRIPLEIGLLTNRNYTPLSAAIKQGNIELVKKLLNNGAEISISNVYSAVRKKNLKLLNVLYTYNPKVFLNDHEGNGYKMITTLAKAGFSYIFRFFSFIFLAIAVNVSLALVYFENIASFLSGKGVLIGLITLATILIFPIIWFIVAKKTALLVAIFKVIDESIDDLVAFIIDTFLTDDNKSKVPNFEEILSEQSKVTQHILNFFFDKIDFFGDVQTLMQQENYSDKELKVKWLKPLKRKSYMRHGNPIFGLLFFCWSLILG